MPLPRVLSTMAVPPDACSCFWYQYIGMAGTPYRSYLLRSGAHEIDDGIGMIALEPGHHGFQHALVAEIAGAEEANRPTFGAAADRASSESSRCHRTLSWPATRVSTETMGSASSGRASGSGTGRQGPASQPFRQVAVALPPVGGRQRRTPDSRDVPQDVFAVQTDGRVPHGSARRGSMFAHRVRTLGKTLCPPGWSRRKYNQSGTW